MHPHYVTITVRNTSVESRAAAALTLPGVGVSSHLFLRGVGPSAGLPGVGVASHRLPAPGVAPGVASQWAAGVAPGVASQLLVAGVASTVSQSATLAFLLRQQKPLLDLVRTCVHAGSLHVGVLRLSAKFTP